MDTHDLFYFDVCHLSSTPGALLLPIISINYGDIHSSLGLSDSFKQAYFFIALIAIAIGTGGIKANVGPFGAQQLEDDGEKAVQTFFNW